MAAKEIDPRIRKITRSISPSAELMWYPDNALTGQKAHAIGGAKNPYATNEEKESEVTERRSRAKGIVAVVEDEEDLLSIYSNYLKSRGYKPVFTFLNGEALVEAVAEGKISPDFVLLDYRLPGKNGIETGKRVAAIRPGIKIIVTTADDTIRDEANSIGFRFLLKPFSLASLAQMMDDL
jgi:CheY-like chemotaxis protein